MGLARPAQTLQHARGRAKPPVFLASGKVAVGVGVSAASSRPVTPTRNVALAKGKKDLGLGPASHLFHGLSWPVQIGDVPPSPLAPPAAAKQRFTS